MTAAQFSRVLVEWYLAHPRPLPWKVSKDPYCIWVSEIILQQTRVAQGTPYYHRFMEKYPSVFDLAAADESEVLKTWEGLGYYSRARNLHSTARYIVNNLGGKIPDDYESLVKLKGVGPYTAAAISSFAFEQKLPSIDGNVARFIARLLGITEPIESQIFKSKIQKFAGEAIQHALPSEFNQAMINFGAMVCKPANPECRHCPFQEYCIAYREEMIAFIPFKSKKIVKKDRFLHFFLVSVGDACLIEKREGEDIWKNLHSLPYIEADSQSMDESKLTELFRSKYLNCHDLKPKLQKSFHTLKQTLTHQIIHGVFYKAELANSQNQIKPPFNLVESKNLSNFAFPKIIRTYFSKIGLLS